MTRLTFNGQTLIVSGRVRIEISEISGVTTIEWGKAVKDYFSPSTYGNLAFWLNGSIEAQTDEISTRIPLDYR